MDIDFGLEAESLRTDIRAWLDHNRIDPLPLSLEERFPILRDWQRRLYDAGWVGLGWPEEYGGRGGNIISQVVFNQELARAKSPPPVGLIGLEVVGPTLLRFGTEKQKRSLIPRFLSGEHIWCQGFSEPEAGSDLASLKTKAVVDGDDFLVSGQKIWTSYAQYAKWCALLVRTDMNSPKHRGISYLLVDMDSPGITVRPLEQMTGDSEFNEVFFDRVRVPQNGLLGSINQGWQVAMTTLAFERGPHTLRRLVELRVALDELVQAIPDLVNGRMARGDSVLLTRLGECEMLMRVLEAQGYKIIDRFLSGELGDAGSVEKLLLARVEQTIFGFALDLLGPYRSVGDGDRGPLGRLRWIHDYLYSRAVSIYAGSSEIQRGILATRALGLPRA